VNYKSVISILQILILIGAMIVVGVYILSIYMANIWGDMYQYQTRILPFLYGVVVAIIFTIASRFIWRENNLIVPLISILVSVVLLSVQIYIRTANPFGNAPNNSVLLFHVSAALLLSFVADIGKFIHK